MKKIYWMLPVITILLIALVSSILTANKSLEKSETLPVFNLSNPKNPAGKVFLGLSGECRSLIYPYSLDAGLLGTVARLQYHQRDF